MVGYTIYAELNIDKGALLHRQTFQMNDSLKMFIYREKNNQKETCVFINKGI